MLWAMTPLFLLLLHIFPRRGLFSLSLHGEPSEGVIWFNQKGHHQPAQRLTGCPGSVITVLMLSILKVQYCDNWRMAANLPSIGGSSPSVPEGRWLKKACGIDAGTPEPSYTVPPLYLLLQGEKIVLSVFALLCNIGTKGVGWLFAQQHEDLYRMDIE